MKDFQSEFEHPGRILPLQVLFAITDSYFIYSCSLLLQIANFPTLESKTKNSGVSVSRKWALHKKVKQIH